MRHNKDKRKKLCKKLLRKLNKFGAQHANDKKLYNTWMLYYIDQHWRIDISSFESGFDHVDLSIIMSGGYTPSFEGMRWIDAWKLFKNIQTKEELINMLTARFAIMEVLKEKS